MVSKRLAFERVLGSWDGQCQSAWIWRIALYFLARFSHRSPTVRLLCEKAGGRRSRYPKKLSSERVGLRQTQPRRLPSGGSVVQSLEPKSQGELNFFGNALRAIIGHDAAAFTHERWLIARVHSQIVHVGWRTPRGRLKRLDGHRRKSSKSSILSA